MVKKRDTQQKIVEKNNLREKGGEEDFFEALKLISGAGEKKKDVQQKIVERDPSKERASEEEFSNILRMVAPGTHIRTAIDGILKGKKGAIIAVENDFVPPIAEGGFKVNARFTPQRLIELSKMDAAIILSKDMKRIVSANVLLTPNSKIQTNETGTRHKAAERTARQAGTLVIAISERKNEITIYYKNIKHKLIDSGDLLRKANEHVQMLEKQRELFDKSLDKLNHIELRNYPSLDSAIYAIQKGKMIEKISNDLKKQIIELGKEGALIKTRVKEITADVGKETELIVKDYSNLGVKKSKVLLDDLGFDELVDKDNVLSALGYESMVQTEPVQGWRILSKTSLPEADIAAIIKEAQSLGKAIHSNRSFHETILGVDKAKAFRTELEDIKLNI